MAEGPVAQWIERQASNLRAEVRFLPGPLRLVAREATRRLKHVDRTADSPRMSPVVARAIAVAQLLAGLCLAGFALHTVLPDSGGVSYAFDYYVYYGLVICAVALALGRAATRPHRLGWAALATAVCAFAAGEFLSPDSTRRS